MRAIPCPEKERTLSYCNSGRPPFCLLLQSPPSLPLIRGRARPSQGTCATPFPDPKRTACVLVPLGARGEDTEDWHCPVSPGED